MLTSVSNIFIALLFIYCALSVAYLFVFALAGRLFYRKEAGVSTNPVKKIAILVPAYKEDGIIMSTAKNLLSLDYPTHLYQVFILADSFQKDTISQLSELPLSVIEVKFDKSTKAKALNEGFRVMNDEYDIALVCDADNMLATDFLRRLDAAFVAGHKAVQGRRVAKNLDSSFAILDASSEAINNNIFRKGANALGLSSAVIGSGMAFRFNDLKKALVEIDAVGGFDKPLQLKIVGQEISILYLEDALAFDEKVGSSQAFGQQRKRWVSSQFIYLKQFFFPALRKLFQGNISYFNLAVANNLVLPRAFLLAVLPVLVILAFLFVPSWAWWFTLVWILYIITLAIALPAVMVNKDLLKAALRLPKAIGLMILALFQMKKSNKTFIHTVHTKTEVSNTLFK
jgi:cellulose synthase/poly-beta-1,6-N-acetylglucosamine synthase-like glycosyltransferase